MSYTTERNYRDFFKEELYDGFVNYLIDELGHAKVITLLRGKPLFTKRGVNNNFKVHFNRFLDKNPAILKRFVEGNQKCMSLRNIADGELQFPIDTEDESLMIREGIRNPQTLPLDIKDHVYRPSKGQKNSTKPLTGQVIKGENHERKYFHPKRLTVHFKQGYALKLGKTTESFMVNSRSEAMDIIIGRFERRVAYATIQNEEQFVFVKPRNGKIKRSRKLRNKIQQ